VPGTGSLRKIGTVPDGFETASSFSPRWGRGPFAAAFQLSKFFLEPDLTEAVPWAVSQSEIAGEWPKWPFFPQPV
jgi:hypothetical protein